MFTFSIQRDTVRIEASDFARDRAQAITDEIHRRYANKILPGVGLCLSVLDLLDASEGAVLYGDGCLYHKVDFRMIVFRPFLGEAFTAKIQSSTEQGIKLTVGFFDDIWVPIKHLPKHSAFDVRRQCWFWVPDPPEGTDDMAKIPPVDRLYFERGDVCVCSVEQEVWDDHSPATTSSAAAPPQAPPQAQTQNQGAEGQADASTAKQGRPPYQIIATMAEQGMGVLDWWGAPPDDEEEEG